MEDKTKKMVIVLIASIGIAIFIYFKFIHTSKNETDFSQMGNYQNLDKGEQSKTDLYREKQKKELQRIAEERKVSSLETFLSDQVTKTPFEDSSQVDTTTIKKVIPAEQETNAQTLKPIKERVIVKYVQPKANNNKTQNIIEEEEGKPVELESKSRRNLGFAKINPHTNSVTTQDSNDGSEINIPVVVQQTTKVKGGNNILLRTTEQALINGKVIPVNTIISGKVSLSSDRLNITVNSFKAGDKYINQKLIAYSADGSQGISVEGGVVQDVKKDVVNEALNTVQQTVNVPILKDIPTRSSKKIVNDPEIPITKGHKLFLKQE
jgi:hypothetical protein